MALNQEEVLIVGGLSLEEEFGEATCPNDVLIFNTHTGKTDEAGKLDISFYNAANNTAYVGNNEEVLAFVKV